MEAAFRRQQVKDRLRLFARSHDAQHLLAAVQLRGEFAVGQLPQVLKGYTSKYGGIDRRCDFTNSEGGAAAANRGASAG